MKLMTIGYEKTDSETFIATLKEAGVETLVDVRELPLSRKKGFSKTALTSVLRENGIDYVHIKSLGCPKQVRHEYKNDDNWDTYKKKFMAHLAAQNDALATLNQRISHEVCCLLCFEADPSSCHRSLVATRLYKKWNSNIEIVHLTVNQTATSAVSVT